MRSLQAARAQARRLADLLRLVWDSRGQWSRPVLIAPFLAAGTVLSAAASAFAEVQAETTMPLSQHLWIIVAAAGASAVMGGLVTGLGTVIALVIRGAGDGKAQAATISALEARIEDTRTVADGRVAELRGDLARLESGLRGDLRAFEAKLERALERLGRGDHGPG